MHHRPLALVSVLAIGDYLLWNWSLQGNHDVLALISGLTLVLLAIALIWLLILTTGQLLTRIAQRPPAHASASAAQRGKRMASGSGQGQRRQRAAYPDSRGTPGRQQEGEPAERASSSKLAA